MTDKDNPKRDGRSKDPKFNRRSSRKSQQKGNSKPLTKKDSTKDMRRSREIEGTAREEYISQSNPYAWYANFPQYADDVARLSFGLPVGQPLLLNTVSNQKDAVAASGLMTIHFTPCPGISKDMTSPINRQAVRVYSYLRSMLRSANAYDAADLMMYMLGVDSLYTYWAYLRRAYGVAQLFTPMNKYYPRRLLQAMGISPDIVNNLADFRAYINRFALNIGRFAMPKDFDLTARHQWMCSGLYLDGQGTRAQTYMFVPALFWQFDNTVETGSQLKGVQFGSFESTPTFRTLDQLITFGETLIADFDNDEDTMNISGDIYRAYNGNLFSVEETPDNYSVVPIYDETVLSQIENSIAVGRWVNSSNTLSMPVISQNPTVNNGAIIFNPTCDGGGIVSQSKRLRNFSLMTDDCLLNWHGDSPNSQQVMEMTRLVTRANPGLSVIVADAEANVITLESSGSDIVNYYRVCQTNPDNPAGVRFLLFATNTVWYASGTILNATGIELLPILQQFDWGPMFYLVAYNLDTEVVNLAQIAADIDNMTSVTRAQIGYINEAALLSLLDTPTPIQK